jgi:selenocysteine lyase/cysteine desulfurase
MTHLSANPGRGSHSASLKAGGLVYRARQALAHEVGLSNPDRVVFTSSCTEALNLAILGSLKKGHVITTVFEHNSVLRTLFSKAREYGVEISIADANENGIDAKSIERLIRKDTFMVIVNHVSNVTGQIAPLFEIGRICNKYGVTFVVDGAQSVGYNKIDMAYNNIDMLAIAPHKGLHAIMGIGALAVSEKVTLNHIKFGGTGTSSIEIRQPNTFPDGYEAGTLPLVAISSVIPAINWCEKNRVKNDKRIFELSELLLKELKSMRNVKIYTPHYLRNGIISFNLEGVPSNQVFDILSTEYDICVRGGLHCAPLTHRHLGTLDGGAVRVSLSGENTVGEIEDLIVALTEICN